VPGFLLHALAAALFICDPLYLHVVVSTGVKTMVVETNAIVSRSLSA